MTSFLPTPRLNAASMLALWILGVHISSIVVGAPLNVSDSAENNATGDSSSSNGTFFNSNGTSIMPGCTAPSLEEMDPPLALYALVTVVFLIGLVLVIPGKGFTVVTLLVRSLPNWFTVCMCAVAVLDSITLCLASFTMIRFENHFLYQATLTFQAFSNWILFAIRLKLYAPFRPIFPDSQNCNNYWKIQGPSIVVSIIIVFAFLTTIIFYWSYIKVSPQQVAATSARFLPFILPIFLVILSLLGALGFKLNARSRKPMMSARTLRRSITLESQLARITLLIVLFSVPFTFYFLAAHILFALLSTSSNQDTVACPSRNFVSVFLLVFFLIISCVNPVVHFYTYYSCAQGFRDKRSKPRDIELSRDGSLRQS